MKFKITFLLMFLLSCNCLFGQLKDEHEYTVIKDGKWDAYFELSGKTNVGFNLRNTPFGQSEFDYRPQASTLDKYHYEDIYTGLVFYKTIDHHILKRGWVNAITDDFKPELIRRMKIIGFDV